MRQSRAVKLDQRFSTLQQLIDSQMSFISALETLSKAHARIEAENAKKRFIAPETVSLVFRDLKAMSGFAVMLRDMIERKLSEWTPESSVSDIFLEFTPFLKVFSAYSDSHDLAIEKLKSACANQDFARFWMELEKEISPNAKLTSLLELPGQRLSEYLKAVGSLQIATSQSNPDHDALETVYNNLKALTDKSLPGSNTNKVTRVSEIQKELVGFTGNLVRPGRFFLYEGEVKKLNLDTFGQDPSKNYWMYAFTDCIIFARYYPNTNKKDFRDSVFYSDDFIVREIKNGGKVLSGGFFISDLHKTLTIGCDKYLTEKWVKVIDGAASQHRASQNSLGVALLKDNPEQRRVRNITASIPDTVTIKPRKGGAYFHPYTEYIIYVETDKYSFVTQRRFKQFEALKEAMKEKYPYIETPNLPSKHLVNNMSASVIFSRKVMLESFLLRLLSHPVLSLEFKLMQFLTPDPERAEEVIEEVPEESDTPVPNKKNNANRRDIGEYLLELAGLGKDKYENFDKYATVDPEYY